MVQALGRWPVNVDGPGSRPVRVSFVVDKVALERRIFFFQSTSFFPCHYHSSNTPYSPLPTFDVHRAVHRNIISIVKPTRCTNVSNLFYFGVALHVSDGLSAHHQQFKSVHTPTGICQKDTAVC